MQPEVVHSDNVFRVAYWHNAVIVDVRGDIDLAHMQRLGRAYQALVERYPEGIVCCAFLRAEVPVSSREVRAESARFMRGWAIRSYASPWCRSTVACSCR